jgi:hypothetical protein
MNLTLTSLGLTTNKRTHISQLTARRSLLTWQQINNRHTPSFLNYIMKFSEMQFIKKSNKMQQYIKIFTFLYLYEAQHVSDDSPPIIRSLNLQWQPLVFQTWEVVGRTDGRHSLPSACLTVYVWKIKRHQCSFRLLMMGGVSLETCCASYWSDPSGTFCSRASSEWTYPFYSILFLSYEHRETIGCDRWGWSVTRRFVLCYVPETQVSCLLVFVESTGNNAVFSAPVSGS